MSSSSGKRMEHAVFYGMFFMHLCKQSSRWKKEHAVPPARLLCWGIPKLRYFLLHKE